MGEIFLARLEGAAGFEKLYAVKRILPHLADDMRFRSMLIDEAQIASKLSHPNICQVYELGESEGELYIAMEYLEGITLLPVLRQAAQQEQPLELGLVACVIQQITEGLHYAHELRDRNRTQLNVVHRDVTPSNIFVTESGVAKVLDFGIAKARNVSSNTQTGTIKGKHAYMAPEQLRGAPLDRRVDVFAVGVLLFEMLALRRLFQRRTDYLTLQAVMEDPIPDVRRFRNDLPDALVMALGHALQRDRDQRFETVRMLGAAVVESIASEQRVWSASELGDQLATRFGAELKRKNGAVLAAVSRSPGGAIPSLDELEVHARQTATDATGVDAEYGGGERGERDRAATYSDDDQGDLPSLGSALTDMLGEAPTAMERGGHSGPVAVPTAIPTAMASGPMAMAPMQGMHSGPTAMPGMRAGAGNTGSMTALPPLAGTGAMPMLQSIGSTGSVTAIGVGGVGPGYPGRSSSEMMVPAGSMQLAEARPRRTWPWVLFAVALLGIAGAALVIVWRNSQQQQQPQTVLVFERGGGGVGSATGGQPREAGGSGAVVGGGDAGAGDAAVEVSEVTPDAGAGSAGTSGGSGAGKREGKRDPKLVLREKIAALRPEIARCAHQPEAQAADVEGKVLLQIDKRGQVSSLEITPASLAGTPLATCIKAAFSSQRFPEQKETLAITVPFSTKRLPL